MKSLLVNKSQKPKDSLTHRRVKKNWGSEESIGLNPYYESKIMTVTPGFHCSIHFHKIKKETFILVEGELIVETINMSNGKMSITHLQNKYDNITIINEVPHRFYCPDGQKENTVFIEVSTEDSADDNYRIFPSGKK